VVSLGEDRQAVLSHAERACDLKTKTPLLIRLLRRHFARTLQTHGDATTLLIGDDGKVEHARVGKWDEEKANEVAAALISTW